MRLLAIMLLAIVGNAAHGIESAQCQLSEQELGRLTEFQNIKGYLKANVFPDWPEEYPNLFFYDDECQYVLNYPGTLDGFSLSPQKFRLPGFRTDAILYRRNSVKAPFGDLDYVIPAQGFTWGTPGSEKWFVMALYPVWKREWKDKLSMWHGMLSHEMFHPYQFTLPSISEKLDRLDESTFTKFYLSHGDFQKEVDAEFVHLRQAVTARSETARKSEVRKFLELREKRRIKYLPQASFIADEPAMETAEGVAEYMNFRVMTDSKRLTPTLMSTLCSGIFRKRTRSKRWKPRKATLKRSASLLSFC